MSQQKDPKTAPNPGVGVDAIVSCECGQILPYLLTLAIEKFINQKDVVHKDIDVSILEHALVDAKNCPNCRKYYANADFSS